MPISSYLGTSAWLVELCLSPYSNTDLNLEIVMVCSTFIYTSKVLVLVGLVQVNTRDQLLEVIVVSSIFDVSSRGLNILFFEVCFCKYKLEETIIKRAGICRESVSACDPFQRLCKLEVMTFG